MAFMKKNEEEYDDGGFSYNDELRTNEFNDATIEYGEGEEVIEEDDTAFEEENTRDFDKSKLLFYIVIGVLLILLVVVFMLRGCVLTPGTLKDIKITSPDIIYVGEKALIKATAKGKNNLNQTVFMFDTSNNGIVEIEAKGFVQGKTVKNNLIPLTTGRFVLQVSANLDDVKLKPVEKEIVICRALNENSFATNELTAVIGKSIPLNIDLGEEKECLQNYSYDIKDKSIVKIDSNGNLVGLKKGTTTITFINGDKSLTKTVNVDTDSVSVTGISFAKTTVSLKVGDKLKLNPTIKPENASNKNVNYTSSNVGIVNVSKTGEITGVGKGTAIVKATTQDGSYSSMITVNVTAKTSGGQTTGGGTQTGDKTDTKAPTLTSVKIYSDNVYKTYAKKGNKITLEMTADEAIVIKPSVVIGGKAVSTICSGTNCRAVLDVTNDITDGKILFQISSYKDKAGNVGKVVSTTTDKSSVIVDKTAPICTATFMSRGTNSESVKFVWYDSKINSSIVSGVRAVTPPVGNVITAKTGQDLANNSTYSLPIVQANDTTYKMVVQDWAGNIGSCSRVVLKNATQKTYTLTINKGTGISSISSSTISCKTTGSSCTVTLPENASASEGYTFIGFNDTNTSTAKYSKGQTITLTGNKTIYAVASKNAVSKTYNVTYKTTTGVQSITKTSDSCTTSETSTACNIALPTIIAKSTYSALGWSTSSSATKAAYKPRQTISISSNMTLYTVTEYIGSSYDDDDDEGGSSSGGGTTTDPSCISGMKQCSATEADKTKSQGGKCKESNYSAWTKSGSSYCSKFNDATTGTTEKITCTYSGTSSCWVNEGSYYTCQKYTRKFLYYSDCWCPC